MDYSATYAIIALAALIVCALVLLRRGIHARGVDISFFGGRAKFDELIVSADRERHAVEGKVEAPEPGAGAEKSLPPSEKPASIELKREDPGELAA